MVKRVKLSPLDEIGWLAQQSDDFVEWAGQVGRWKNCKKGQFIYHAGDRADGLYGLASGSVLMTFPLVADEPVVIHRAEVGFWIGDAAELTNRPRMVTLMAASQARLLHLPSSAIKILLANRPEQWRSFYQLSATNMYAAITQLAEVLALTVRARVCRRLLALSTQDGFAATTQEELARLLGVARPTLRRCLADLESHGAIETNYRKVRILDPAVLSIFKDEQ
jgi:CRP-like cAMP-binding protein